MVLYKSKDKLTKKAEPYFIHISTAPQTLIKESYYFTGLKNINTQIA